MTETELQLLIHDLELLFKQELSVENKKLINHWAATRFENFWVPTLFMLSAFLATKQQGGDTRKELDRILGQLAEDLFAAYQCVEQMKNMDELEEIRNRVIAESSQEIINRMMKTEQKY